MKKKTVLQQDFLFLGTINSIGCEEEYRGLAAVKTLFV